MAGFTSAVEGNMKKSGSNQNISNNGTKHRDNDRRMLTVSRFLKTQAVLTQFGTQDLATFSMFQSISPEGKQMSIFRAAEVGDLQTVASLIHQTGAEIRKAKTRCTLLHVAAANNHIHIVKFLLMYISPNVVNRNKQTPAHVGAIEGSLDILKVLLIDPRINKNMQDVWQRTYKDWLAGSLFEAVLASDERQTRVLLELGANPDCHVGSSLAYLPEEDLNVTTARQLAMFLGEERIMDKFVEADKCENFRCT